MIVSDRSPSFIQWNAPVEPNDLGSGLRHGRQKRRAVGTEIDDGNFGFLLQALNELRGGHQYVAAIILDTQTAYPAVEDLQGVSPRAYLLGRVLCQHIDQFGDQFVPHLGRVVHQLLNFQVVPRSATLDHVAGESERCTAKADDRQLRPKMFGHECYGIRHVAQLPRPVGTKRGYVFRCADRLLNNRTFAGCKVKGQAHYLERQEQISKDDGRVNVEELRGSNGNFGSDLRFFADL